MSEAARLRRRLLLAMLAACGGEGPKTEVPVASSAPAPTPAPIPAASASASASASAAPEPPPPPVLAASTSSSSSKPFKPPPRPPVARLELQPLQSPGYQTTFPRPKDKQEWCTKEGTAVCHQWPMGGDVSTCPREGQVDCPVQRIQKSWQYPPGGCFGTLAPDVSQRERKAGRKDVCCYDVGERCGIPGEGRPLRASWDAPAILAPAISRGREWSMELHGRAAPDFARSSRWLDAARAEHASVAAFAKLSLDLVAHGAPADLLARTHQAALEEVAHARMCFALAARFAADDHLTLGPGAMTMPSFATPSLVDLARETFRDGCIGEGAAAARARRSAESAEDDAERAVLLIIADDEERHAELAWSIVGWAAARDAEIRATIDAEISLHAEGRDRLAGLAPS